MSNLATRDYRVALTLKSRNEKTGPIPVSTTTAQTCPAACPLADKGCYAKGGPLAIFWRGVTEGKFGMAWREFCAAVADLPAGQLWRHNQAGDLPGDRVKIDARALSALVKANRGKRGFTYTHYSPAIAANLKALNAAVLQGFIVNLSGNSVAHADQLARHGLPVVTVLPHDVDGKKTPVIETAAGNKIAICPATYRDTSCAECGLCARADRKVIVGFPAHGAAKRAASTIAERV